MTIKNFIFDIDGTLINTFELYMPALIDVLAEDGHHFTDPVQAEKDLYGIAAMDALHKLNLSGSELEAIRKEWIGRAYQNFDRVRVFAGVPELITQLASQSGTRLAIVTSKTRAEYRQYFQNQYEFAKYFSVVVTADDTQFHKPSAEPILLALARLGAQPATAVYVGDMLTDFIAAHAAKIKFAGADYGSEDPQKIADADFHLASLAGLIRLNGEGVVQS